MCAVTSYAEDERVRPLAHSKGLGLARGQQLVHTQVPRLMRSVLEKWDREAAGAVAVANAVDATDAADTPGYARNSLAIPAMALSCASGHGVVANEIKLPVELENVRCSGLVSEAKQAKTESFVRKERTKPMYELLEATLEVRKQNVPMSRRIENVVAVSESERSAGYMNRSTEDRKELKARKEREVRMQGTRAGCYRRAPQYRKASIGDGECSENR